MRLVWTPWRSECHGGGWPYNTHMDWFGFTAQLKISKQWSTFNFLKIYKIYIYVLVRFVSRPYPASHFFMYFNEIWIETFIFGSLSSQKLSIKRSFWTSDTLSKKKKHFSFSKNCFNPVLMIVARFFSLWPNLRLPLSFFQLIVLLTWTRVFVVLMSTTPQSMVF